MVTKQEIAILPQHIIEELEALDSNLKVFPGSLQCWLDYGNIAAQYNGHDFDWEPQRLCDKCGQPTSWNSALLIEEQCLKTFSGFYDRHFYPTESCEGSPSRVECFTGENSEYREKALKVISLSRGIWEVMNKYYPKGSKNE